MATALMEMMCLIFILTVTVIQCLPGSISPTQATSLIHLVY